MFSVSLLRRQLRLRWQWGVWGREKGKKCAGVACQKSKSVDRVLNPCGLMTRPGVPWGFSSHKLLQVQSPRKIFLHSNVPIWRQASALWVLPSCFYALFIRNVCCLNLDSVVFHSDVCLASFLLFSNVCCQWFHLADRRHQRHVSRLRYLSLPILPLSSFRSPIFHLSPSISSECTYTDGFNTRENTGSCVFKSNHIGCIHKITWWQPFWYFILSLLQSK